MSPDWRMSSDCNCLWPVDVTGLLAYIPPWPRLAHQTLPEPWKAGCRLTLVQGGVQPPEPPWRRIPSRQRREEERVWAAACCLLGSPGSLTSPPGVGFLICKPGTVTLPGFTPLNPLLNWLRREGRGDACCLPRPLPRPARGDLASWSHQTWV